MSKLKDLYNRKYINETWAPIELRPYAMHTNAYDDTYRLLKQNLITGNILELGCGSGKLAVALAEYGYNVIGYDLSDVRIKLANAVTKSKYPHLSAKLNFISGDIDDIIPGERRVLIVQYCALFSSMCQIRLHCLDSALKGQEITAISLFRCLMLHISNT